MIIQKVDTLKTIRMLREALSILSAFHRYLHLPGADKRATRTVIAVAVATHSGVF
jgi:hypothetical protein